jgi:menaquinol-cytochrome c reductase iron-sulfur subunit
MADPRRRPDQGRPESGRSEAARGPSAQSPAADLGRRGFLERVAATIVGLLVGVVPLAAGLYTFLDPLRKKRRPKWVHVAWMDEVPADGVPRRFPVISDRWDAWNYYPPEPIGAVYLRRTAANEKPIAFTVICPHLGCSVDYSPSSDCFKCPCHNSVFDVNGTVKSGPPPRGMDTLEVEARADEIWVNFQRFKAGHRDKEPA